MKRLISVLLQAIILFYKGQFHLYYRQDVDTLLVVQNMDFKQ